MAKKVYEKLTDDNSKYNAHLVAKIINLIIFFSTDKEILLQALEEGYVILSIIKLLLVGPPAVGKTSFKHLLFNWKPPHHHHSTAIADRPIRAVERIATLKGAKSWEIITTEELMEMLAEDIHIQAKDSGPILEIQSSNTSKKAPLNIKNIEMKDTPQPTNQSLAQDLPSLSLDASSEYSNIDLTIHSEANQEQSSKPKVEIASEDTQPKKLDDLEEKTKSMLKVKHQSNEYSQESQSVTNDVVAPKAAEKESILNLSKDILTAMRNTASRQLSQSTWIYVLDSGGQPQFTDVSRAFVRGNTVIVIVHKLTDRLSSKPIF